ncbi:MAG: DUF2887 domain-containing protein [Desulfobacterales bacterium]|nr:DUF2887 domain-containing protein [Desulfobacterales bacterium]
MKTDALFYELFKLAPSSLFDLVGLDIDSEYIFESITVKSTEKRFDGFFKSLDDKEPNIFLEVQGYYDPMIYWRFFREICSWYEQSQSKKSFIGILLFIDKKYDPENCPLSSVEPNKIVVVNLIDCLKNIKTGFGVLTVLKPLILRTKKQLKREVYKWKADIENIDLPENKTQTLLELLEYAILQKFTTLTIKEVEKMLELTPLEKTVAGKELIQIGIEKGIKKGLEKGIEKGVEKGIKKGLEKGIKKGEVIGKIHMAQRFLKIPLTPKNKLVQLNVNELAGFLKDLESKLNI